MFTNIHLYRRKIPAAFSASERLNIAFELNHPHISAYVLHIPKNKYFLENFIPKGIKITAKMFRC